MSRRALPAVALLALLVAGLAWWGLEEDAGRVDVPAHPGPSILGAGPGPARLGHGVRPEDTDPSALAAPTGAWPDAAADGEVPIDPDQTRIHGTVRLRGTEIRACSGVVELLLVKPERWPGSWEELQRLIDERRFWDGIDHHADIREDGTWQTDVGRGVRIARTRVRTRPSAELRPSNFVDTRAPARIHVVGEQLAVDLEVDPGLQLEGRARDARTGLPVAGALVVRATLEPRKAGGLSRTDGAFVIAGLRPQDVDGRQPLAFRVEHPDYVHQVVVARYDPGRRAYAPLDVRLERGVRVAGVVRMDGEIPRREVNLFLVRAADRAAPLGVAEQGLARTTTGKDGRFAFPPVAPTADATLFVPSQGSSIHGGGAGFELSGLDLRKDRTDLQVALSDTWGAALRVRYPDGSLVPWRRTRAIVLDATGHWCPVSWGDSKDESVRWVSVQPGRGHRIVVFSQRLEEDGSNRSYRGEIVARVQSPEEARRGVWVDLEPYDPPASPPNEQSTFGVRCNGATPYAQSVWQLQIKDAVTGAPLGGRVLDIDAGGGQLTTLTLRADGRVRLEVGLGLLRVRFHVEGHEPLEVRLEAQEPGYAEATVALHPRKGD